MKTYLAKHRNDLIIVVLFALACAFSYALQWDFGLRTATSFAHSFLEMISFLPAIFVLIGLVDAHTAELEVHLPLTINGSPFTLPTPPDLLTKDDTTLHDIAIYFLRPAWCGLDLTRSELTQMGRQLQIPSGFAERETQFVNLLRTASQSDHCAALLSKLAERIEHDKRYYQEFPFLSHSIHASGAVWMQRLEKSEQLLEELKKMAITQQTAAAHGAQAAS